MSNFLSRLFLGEHVPDVITDSAKSTFNLIDEAFNTDDEKRTAKQEALKLIIEAHKFTANDGNAPARFWFLQQITNFTFVLATGALIAALNNNLVVVSTIKDIAIDFNIGWAFVATITFFFIADITSASGFKFPAIQK
jgi:hypothetical protein